MALMVYWCIYVVSILIFKALLKLKSRTDTIAYFYPLLLLNPSHH